MNYQIVGEGKTTKVYRDGNIAIKLYTNPAPNEAQNEAERQRFAVESGLPVPKVFEVKEYDNCIGLKMEYIDGVQLVQPKMNKDDRKKAFEQLVALQTMVHKIDAKRLPKFTDKLSWKIQHSCGLEDNEISTLINLIAEYDNGKTNLCHGDFHTSNILNDGNKLWIIDWVDSACGDPLIDMCRSYLIFKQYLLRMSGIYLRLICKAANVKESEVLKWLPIVAASRLSEGLTSKETAFLTNIVRTTINKI